MLQNPISRVFTTLFLCLLLLNPYINDEIYWKNDAFVVTMYVIICVYLVAKVLYSIIKGKEWYS